MRARAGRPGRATDGRLSRTTLPALALLSALALLVASTSESQALKRRPTVGGSYGDCIADRFDDSSESGCEGSLCWCCYADGCFICNNIYGGTPPTTDVTGEQADCTWDPAYSATSPPGGVGQTVPQNLQQFQVNPNFGAEPVSPPVAGPLDGQLSR
ncbi:MAG: hypothetical protein R3F55_04960 [Alphaproteobacteria bacterium]